MHFGSLKVNQMLNFFNIFFTTADLSIGCIATSRHDAVTFIVVVVVVRFNLIPIKRSLSNAACI